MTGLRLARQRTMAAVARRLASGAQEDWFTALGTSMRPAVRAVQRVRLRPPTATEPLLRRVVLVSVAGRWWLHRVVDERPGEVLIAGDHGRSTAGRRARPSPASSASVETAAAADRGQAGGPPISS